MDYSPRYGQFRAMLRKIREEARMSQTQLAAKLGKSQLFISRSELGERRIDFLEVLDFCSACGITASLFIERLEREAPVHGEERVKRRSPRKMDIQGRLTGWRISKRPPH